MLFLDDRRCFVDANANSLMYFRTNVNSSCISESDEHGIMAYVSTGVTLFVYTEGFPTNG